MMHSTSISTSTVAFVALFVAAATTSTTVVLVDAQQWAPLMTDNTGTLNVPGRSDVNPYGWGDSYSVGNSCYCDTTYDHDIDEVVVSTPLGEMTIRQVCETIGKGPGSTGRPRYNDIQCGHGPANNAGDEDSCPGRIEHGQNGCKYIGPTWNWSPHMDNAAPIPVPVPVTVPMPVAKPEPMPTTVVSFPMSTTEKASLPLLIQAKPMSGPSYSIVGSSNYHLAPWSSAVAVGTGGYDNELFRPHRWTSSNSFTYVISGLLPSATYNLVIGFAETYQPNCEADKRVFHVHVNGESLVQNLDVYSLVGCQEAYLVSQTVTANASGKLDVSFIKSKQNPMVSFINVSEATAE